MRTIDEIDTEFGFYEAKCAGCDIFTRVDDIGLCAECTAKFDRDLIRQRDWEYSATAFGVPEDKLEELRDYIIAQYGERLELIVDDNPATMEKHS